MRAEWGIHFRLVLGLLHALQTGPVTVDRLVAESALSHRSVVGFLRRLEPWLRVGPAGYRLREPVPAWAGPTRGQGEDTLLAMSRLVAGAPRRRRRLDHVVATPETCLRRAQFLTDRYWLDGAHVVLLGDHDLTSLALGLMRNGARLSVVDIDDDLLEYLDRAAGDLGVEVNCLFADLRLGLPPALLESADLVFSDPPYTAEGMRLFAERGCQSLRRDERSRLLLCYGYGELQPTLALNVQAVLHQLRLFIEEVQPRFNRYTGAQAVGSASALYLTRPVPGTWKLLGHKTPTADRIYSHGPSSIESGELQLPQALRGHVVEPTPPAMLWRLCERHAAARPERRPRLPEVAAADLRHAPELAPRLLLTNRVPRLQLVLPAREAHELLDPSGWKGRFFATTYDMRQVATDGGISVLHVERHGRPDVGGAALARYLIDHPGARLRNTLREALIESGRVATKNEARELLGRHPALDAHREARAADLPLHVLRQVAELMAPLAGGSD